MSAVRMRMSRAFRLACSTLILLAGAATAEPLSTAMREVERLRGLTFVHDVAQRSVNRDDLRALLRAEVVKSFPYAPEQYVEILSAFQLVDTRSPELIDKLLDLYQSQVLAFYDPRSHTYFAVRELPAAVAGLGDPQLLQQSVVVHELVHALQDQRFGASQRDAQLLDDADAELAYHALLEGEATLVMIAYVMDRLGQPLDSAIESDTLMNLASMTAAADKTIDASTPRYFVESLKFPYLEGLRLVVEGYRRGGWKEIDRMHANPPRSTREVLHRDEYFKRLSGAPAILPAARSQPNIAGTLSVEHIGEFQWRFLVGEAAAGWVDDRVTFVQNPACDMTVLAETQWETADNALAFRDAYVALLRRRGIEPSVSVKDRVVKVAYGADVGLAEGFVR
jgi:hypothetical protein